MLASMLQEWEDWVQAGLMQADLLKVAFVQALPLLGDLAEAYFVRRRDRTRTKPATGTRKQSCQFC